MRTQRTLVPAAVVGSLAAVALAAAPAQAQQLSTGDVARDVAAFRQDGSSTRRPDIENGDVRRITVAHKARKVTLRVSFRDLAKNVDGLLQYTIIKTPSGSQDLPVVAQAGSRAGVDQSSCGAATHTINYRKDVFTYSVPRSCLGSPEWVRVGFASVTWVGDRQRADDAQRDNGIGDGIVLSRRLARG